MDPIGKVSIWIVSYFVSIAHRRHSYILIAISEILAIITGLEYAFTKAPKNMRSLVTAVFLAMNAFSSALGEAFVCEFTTCRFLTRCLTRLLALSADPLLVWNYGSMGVLAFVAGTIFWFQFRHLDQEEEALNALAVGRVNGVKVESDPVP
jgi:POT family proton-dependent oligopeptide transporter